MDMEWLGAQQARDQIAGGGLTSVELTAQLLERIRKIDAPDSATALRSVLAVNPQAMDEAAAADRGELTGPLRGVPVLVKDNVDCVGLPGTAGSTALAGRAIATDAPLVARLRAAGAVILGAANLSEWANIRSSGSTSGWSAVGGLVRNPWRLTQSAGGSSSGSGAAVAAGLAPLAVGTETDGSITCPASLNGVVGIKPTVGTVSTERVIPVSASQDSPGPMARSVADAAALLEVMSGQRGLLAAAGAPTQGIRLGIVETWFTGHQQADALLADALAHAGAFGMTTAPVAMEAIPEEVQMAEFHVLLCELEEGLAQYFAHHPDLPVRSLADVVAFNREHADVELAHFSQDYFEQALTLGGVDTDAYRQARARGVAWASTVMDQALAEADVLVSPAYGPAWESNFQTGDRSVGGQCTSPAAVLGWPIITIPMGLADGLPVGMALIGRAGSESRLIAVAAQFERALGLTLRPTAIC